MKRATLFRLATMIAAVLWLAPAIQAQSPEMPEPTDSHELLKQFAGQWTSKVATVPPPGEEAITCQGEESTKMIGGFWLVSEGKGEVLGSPMTSVLTIGYDPAKQKYVGTFVCSADSTMWQYEGKMDETGKKLTLEAEGPSMLEPGKTAKYRDVLELVDKDHKTLTSFMESDGEWVKVVTAEYERKK